MVYCPKSKNKYFRIREYVARNSLTIASIKKYQKDHAYPATAFVHFYTFKEKFL